MATGMKLLHSSAHKGDSLAKTLLCSFVLPVSGLEEDAEAAILEIQSVTPMLAMRLRLARAFGLTKLLPVAVASRSEEHTSELQSQSNLVCRLLLEKKKTYPNR